MKESEKTAESVENNSFKEKNDFKIDLEFKLKLARGTIFWKDTICHIPNLAPRRQGLH